MQNPSYEPTKAQKDALIDQKNINTITKTVAEAVKPNPDDTEELKKLKSQTAFNLLLMKNFG